MSPSAADATLAIVDLETTGVHPEHDRVTEVAVIEVDGGEASAEWSTLVNPECTIPPAIQALTGITNDMVAGAPTFARLAEDLSERLAGRVFVAHNARFDYGFLRQGFARAGIDFRAKTLCTVKLSRRLYPQHPRHNLDSLIARHGLRCRARHRALGDADAVWQFLKIAAEEHGEDVLHTAARQVSKQPSLPPYLERAMVDAIPEAPGVYLFYGESGNPLYVGKSKAMRSRVLAHFSESLRSSREMQLAREVRHVEWERSAGELGALLREAGLVKRLLPVYNRQLRRPAQVSGYALAAPKTAAWPWAGPVGVVEQDREREATEVHVVHQWRYLGTARTEDEVPAILEGARRPAFDLDQYKILVRHLLAKRVRVVELACTRS
ncbi:MAG: exonuclease domain-containing protein [Burkholderiales bacterium]